VERLEQAFKSVDTDSSGSISAKEMRAHITKV
jgi:Ca2+-binding EF-hand superfamily protein